MNNFRIHSPTLLLFLGIVSCISNKPESQKIDFPKTIHLNLAEAITDSMNLSEITEKVEYIPLQTTDSALMGNIYYYVVTADYYFIKDGLRILKYDNNGRFINSLFNVGRGPGETGARRFTVNEAGERVYVLDAYNSEVKVYDYNGTFIKIIKKPIAPTEYWIWSIEYFNNNLFVSTAQRPNVKYLYSCFDLKNDSIRILYKNYRNYGKSQENKMPFTTYDYIYQITDSIIMFKEWFCDTIFKVNKGFMKAPSYIIDLGNQKLAWEGWRDHGMFGFASGLPYGYWVQSFIETNTFLYISLISHKGPEIFAVYNKSINSLKIFARKVYKRAFDQIYLRNDLDNLVPFPPINQDGYLFYHDGCLYSVIEAKEFSDAYKNATEKTKKATKYLRDMAPVFEKVNEFSNPVIMKVHLK